jgi:hypothetical protein
VGEMGKKVTGRSEYRATWLHKSWSFQNAETFSGQTLVRFQAVHI